MTSTSSLTRMLSVAGTLAAVALSGTGPVAAESLETPTFLDKKEIANGAWVVSAIYPDSKRYFGKIVGARPGDTVWLLGSDQPPATVQPGQTFANTAKVNRRMKACGRSGGRTNCV